MYYWAKGEHYGNVVVFAIYISFVSCAKVV